jgi:hypothetical protein
MHQDTPFLHFLQILKLLIQTKKLPTTHFNCVLNHNLDSNVISKMEDRQIMDDDREVLQWMHSVDKGIEKGVSKGIEIEDNAGYNYNLGTRKVQFSETPAPKQAAKLNNFEPRQIQFGEHKHLPTIRAMVNCDFKTGSKRVGNFLQQNRYDYNQPNPSTFLGYAFDQSKQACFKLEFVNEQKQLALLCYRMDGDAFLLTNFFDDLKISCDWAEKPKDDGAWFDDESEDEEEDDFATSIRDRKFYLHMENDSQLVKTWLDNLDGDCSAEDVKSTLLLMSWNIKRKENLKEMQKYQKRMVASLLGLLKKTSVSLPEAQCCCNILRDLLADKDNTLELDTSDQIVLAEALVNWSTVSKRTNSFALPVPVSNNIQLSISEIFAGMKLSLPKEKLSTIKEVRENALKDVATNLSKIEV